ncbi:MAG: radical SAM protein, partial [Thermoplasmatales archaeon]
TVQKERIVKIEYSGVETINHFETETHNYVSDSFLSHNCDTKYSYSGGEKRTVESLLEEASLYGTKFVSVTGGEPLLQPEVYPLMQKLLDNEYTVILETSGSISIEDVPTEDNMIISMDIKTPSSKMVEHNLYENIELLGKKDYLKFVIADDRDFQFSKSIIEKYPFEGEIIFQPEGGKNLKELAEKVLKERLNIRVLPQLHKFIWGDKRGV